MVTLHCKFSSKSVRKYIKGDETVNEKEMSNCRNGLCDSRSSSRLCARATFRSFDRGERFCCSSCVLLRSILSDRWDDLAEQVGLILLR